MRVETMSFTWERRKPNTGLQDSVVDLQGVWRWTKLMMRERICPWDVAPFTDVDTWLLLDGDLR